MGTMAEESDGVRSIRRALDILSLLTDDTPSISVRDIVAATGLPKTTVLRLVQTLEHSGLLWATAGGYMAGPGLWRWAYLARRSWQLPPETQAMMRDLGTRHAETVNLYVLRDAPESLLTRIARQSPGGEGHLATLREWIAAARRDGYAVSHGEREEGLSAVAAPVTGRSGAVVAALALSGPTLRFTSERVTEFAADLLQAGARMSERGFDHPLGPAS